MGFAASAAAQDIRLGDDRPAASRKGHVNLLTDAATVEAGKPQVLELRFRVEEGFHINSHTPKDETLIPTSLKLEPSTGMKLAGEEYPRGSEFRLKIGSGETLDVYQGEVRIALRVVVPRGETIIVGALHYQACDSSSCFPPRNLPVRVLVTGK